ncbi:MAG TPA: VOC family protein [Blastocatellia bacterium]|nr:VOC family protein [Blastocatellia bacterium]
MAITISCFHHTGILVTDIERAAAFYENVLGLENLERPDFGFPGRWYDLKNGYQLHLMSTENLPAHTTDNPKFDRHIALEVPDLEQAAAQLTALGIDFARSSGRGGAAQLFLRDPDGNMIELR